MKKLFAALVLIMLILSLCACTDKEESSTPNYPDQMGIDGMNYIDDPNFAGNPDGLFDPDSPLTDSQVSYCASCGVVLSDNEKIYCAPCKEEINSEIIENN